MPVDEDSSTYLFLDDATYHYGIHAARNMGEFFTEEGIILNPEIKATFPGWEYFAHGMIAEGKAHVKSYMDALVAKGIDTIITLSGQTQYLLNTFIKKLDLNYDIRIVSVLELVDNIVDEQPLYLYAGTFYTRYLRMEDKINSLVVNSFEEKTRNSVEFIPLLNADLRINKITIWQKPVHAEFTMFGFEEKILNKITSEGIDDVKKGTQGKTVVFDPYAYNSIKSVIGKSVVYFGELI